MRLGVAAVNPFTCHPINTAANIALIDEASNGRSYCGFARGAWLDFVGLQPERPITAVKEAMRCVRHLLSRSTEPFRSEVFPITGGDSLRWEHIRADIPFLLGSWGPKMIAAALPYVNEIKLGGSANPGAVQWLRDVIGNDEVGIVVGAVTVVDDDGEVARALARREVALYLPLVAQLDPSVSIEPDRLAGLQAAAETYDWDTAVSYISDELLAKFAFAGTPADIVAQTEKLIAAGANRIEFGTPHGRNPQIGLNLLGKKVLSELG